MKILGLDPGLATIGYAILEVEGRKKTLLSCGVIRTAAGLSLGTRLLEIRTDFASILDTFKPEICAIEQIFFTKNVTTGIQVSHARGVLVLGLEEHGIPIVEFSPSQMKSALTGDGRADKKNIQKMVMLELGLTSPPQPDDAADAVSLALSLAATVR